MIRREFLRWLATAPLVGAIARCEGLVNTAVSPAPATPAGIRFRDVSAQAGLHFVHSNGPRSSLLPEDITLPHGAAGDHERRLQRLQEIWTNWWR